MSRFSDDWDEDWNNQGAMHWANVQRSARGKAGRPILEELIAALDAMPVHELHEGFLAHPGTGQRCAVGALVVHRLMAQGMTEQEALLKASGPDCECRHTLDLHNEDGCTGPAPFWTKGQDGCGCKAWRPEGQMAHESVEAAEQLLPELKPTKTLKGPHNVLAEAMWENDEGYWGKSPADRWQHVRDWAVAALADQGPRHPGSLG